MTEAFVRLLLPSNPGAEGGGGLCESRDDGCRCHSTGGCTVEGGADRPSGSAQHLPFGPVFPNSRTDLSTFSFLLTKNVSVSPTPTFLDPGSLQGETRCSCHAQDKAAASKGQNSRLCSPLSKGLLKTPFQEIQGRLGPPHVRNPVKGFTQVTPLISKQLCGQIPSHRHLRVPLSLLVRGRASTRGPSTSQLGFKHRCAAW